MGTIILSILIFGTAGIITYRRIKKGQNPELLEMFNEGLKEMKRAGEYDKIIGTYVKVKSAIH